MSNIRKIVRKKVNVPKLVELHNRELARVRREAISLFAEHLLTLKDGEVDIREEARRFIASLQSKEEEQQS